MYNYEVRSQQKFEMFTFFFAIFYYLVHETAKKKHISQTQYETKLIV